MNYSNLTENFTDLFNETNIEYMDIREKSRYIVQRILVPIISILGVMGNSVTIIIMTRRRMRSSTNYYLAALALADMLYLTFSFVLSFRHYPDIYDINNYYYWVCIPYIYLLTDTSSNTSVWLTVAFTIERYIAVCYPMKKQTLCTESRAKKAIVGIFLVCFVLTLPTPFEYKVDIEDSSRVRISITELGRSFVYEQILSWMASTLFIFLPLILLAVFNSFLIKSVRVSERRRSTMVRRNDTRESSNQERKITIMLISIIILFIVCQLPTAVVLIYKTFSQSKEEKEKIILDTLGNFFNFLVAINAAGNFILYCLLSKKYRVTFRQTFCPCLKGNFYRLCTIYQRTVNSSNERFNSRLSQKVRNDYFKCNEENGIVSEEKDINNSTSLEQELSQ